MYPLLKRPSSGSSRSPNSQTSPSNPMSKKFKTPMMFTPSGAPSLSRRELWKKELGLDDDESDDPLELDSDEDEPEVDQNEHRRGGHTDAEFEALEIELERKEKRKEELLVKLKDAADKINSYRTKAEHFQQAQRNQLKIMKKTYETYLSEKEETIQTLHEHIEEQDNTIIKLHSKLIGESSTDDDISVSSYKSIKKLADRLGTLQQEKAHLTATLMKAEGRMAKLEEEKDSNNNKLEDEREGLERAMRKIKKENEELKTTQVKCGGTNSNCKDIIKELETEKQDLNVRIRDLENQLADHQKKNQDWEHRFENEISLLRENVVQAELKYKEATATPPKTIVKTVVSEKQTQELEKLQKINQELESQNASSKEMVKKLKEENQNLSADLKQNILLNETTKKELDSKMIVEELYHKCKEKLSSLESELQRNMEQHTKAMEASRDREEYLKNEMKREKDRAEQEAKKKYSKFIDKFEVMKKIINDIANAFIILKKEQHEIKSEMNSICKSIRPAMTDAQKAISQAIKDLNERSRVLVERYRKEMKLRKKFHNELVEIKGNIRVFCRVRPMIHEDGSGQQSENVVTFDSEDDGVLFVDHKNNLKQFEVDRVFTPKSTQLEVFNEVKSLVTSCIDGYNVCIFAYGQTGSGKTFTMEGTVNDPGINQRALHLLFSEVAERLDWEYKLNVSMLEIYNESLRDLLSTASSQSLEIKQSKEGVFVPGLNGIDVCNVEDVNMVFSLGHKNRSTASTNMNEHSSRSHAILVINIVGTNKNTGTKTIGKLNLVDLAGSERVSKSGAEGARMKEAQNINKSLSALGDVIHALKNKNSHIPYRNTKLTYLLQDSLGGDSKTLMVVQVAPVRKNAGETYCSLDFAQRVRNVELGQASKRVESVINESSGTPKSRTPKKRL